MSKYLKNLEQFKSIKQQVKEQIDLFPANKREEIIFDKWSLKDVVAHLSHWMVHDINCLESLVRGEEPFWEPNVEEFNTRGVNARKNKSWDELYSEFTTLSEKLVDLYEKLPVELQDKRFWKEKVETPARFLEEDINHWRGEHLPALIHNIPSDQDWITPKAEIKNSTIGGRGLFATEPIKKDELVVVWRGTYTNKTGAKKAEKQGKLVMQWDTDLFSVEERGEGNGYYINHSCEPNLWMEGAYSLTAMRDVNPGEELTADYAIWEQDENYVSKWVCNCGSKNCRGKLSGKDWKLANIQEKYKGHFSPLINKRIKNL